MGNPAPEPIVLRGHGADVQCVAFATLGTVECLLSGDSNGDVVAWDLALRRPAWRLAAHVPSAGVLSVEAMPAGVRTDGVTSEASETRVLTQGRDGSLKCWHVSGNDPPDSIPSWSVTTGSFHFCAFATLRAPVPDRHGSRSVKAIAVVGAETSAVDVLWLPRDARAEKRADANVHEERASNTEGGIGKETPKRVRTCLAPASDDPTDPTERKLGTVMASAFVAVRCRDSAGGGAIEGVDDATAMTQKPFLVVGYEEGTVCVWDLDASEDGFDFDSGFDSGFDFDFDYGSGFDFDGLEPKTIRKPLWRERVHGDAVTSIASDSNEKSSGFISASADGSVMRFVVEAEATSAEKSRSAVATGDFSSRRYRARVTRVQDHGGSGGPDSFAAQKPTRGVACVASRDDGKIFAAGGWDGRTRVYESVGGARFARIGQKKKKEERKPRRLASLGFHDDVVACLAFRTVELGNDGRVSPYAGWLATGSRDGAVALWPVFPLKSRTDAETGGNE